MVLVLRACFGVLGRWCVSFFACAGGCLLLCCLFVGFVLLCLGVLFRWFLPVVWVFGVLPFCCCVWLWLVACGLWVLWVFGVVFDFVRVFLGLVV